MNTEQIDIQMNRQMNRQIDKQIDYSQIIIKVKLKD